MNTPSRPPLRLAVTGYVAPEAGSVASANALLLRALLERGCEITFFSKSSFVDPRPAIGEHPRFRFIEADNRWADRLRRAVAPLPIVSLLAAQLDTATYHRRLLQMMRRAPGPFDLLLWMGDYAFGRLPGIPTVSHTQGAPGTDARSVLRRWDEVRTLAGPLAAWKWRVLARLRLSRWGLPDFRHSERMIVASSQSQRVLEGAFHLPPERVAVIPYPIDFDLFQPRPRPASAGNAYRALWLGRIIPRKRLDLFLDGAALAIRNGLDLQLTVAGGIGFIPGYERLLRAFPYPDRLVWHPRIPREQVPELIAAHDVIVQPSEEEDFGSAVAEAQACGIPAIIGATNGTADYLSPYSRRLTDDTPEALARALAEMAAAGPPPPEALREKALAHFQLDRIADQLLALLEQTREARP